MGSLELTLKTLTPIWTGGVDATADRLHATGIIGSLRWWYELIVRGLGGSACDPSEPTCIYDPNTKSGICDVCRVFGATGWSRRFRLTVEEQTSRPTPNRELFTDGSRFKVNGKDRPIWYFKGGLDNDIELKVIPLSPGFDTNLILGIFKLIEKRASLAAKSQLGYGFIQIQSSIPAFDYEAFIKSVTENLNRCVSEQTAQNQSSYPNLKNFFFAELAVPLKPGQYAVTPLLNLKYDIRKAFRPKPKPTETNQERDLRHFVCGTTSGELISSKIFMSQVVGGKMRVWGWLPDQMQVFNVHTKKREMANYYNRENAMAVIRAEINKFGKLSAWKEFAATDDPKQYLKSLLEG